MWLVTVCVSSCPTSMLSILLGHRQCSVTAQHHTQPKQAEDSGNTVECQ